MPAEVLRFADFELDRNAYQLRHKGRPLKLERIPLDLLFMLIDKRDQLVTREEILERIWGKGLFLTPTTPSIPPSERFAARCMTTPMRHDSW